MKPRNKKKGFTIVELVVVIAVIAVLAAVLIPTFSNIVKKAQKSSDTQLVRNLNTALVVDGKEPTTMHDALKAAEEAGYLVDKINVSQKENEILWDSVNNCFVYMEKGKSEPTYIPDTEKEEAKPYQLWKIVDEIPAIGAQEYSLYLKGTDYTGAVEVSVGFDAGENTNISSVTYNHNDSANPQNVVIRMNSGIFEANAPYDTVNQYGTIDNAPSVIVDDNCFNVYGNVANLVLKQGKAIAKNGGLITVKEVTAGATVLVENGTIIDNREDKLVGSVEGAIEGSVAVINADGSTKKVLTDKTGDALKEAFELVADGDTVKFLSDVRVSETKINVADRLVIQKNITVNFDEYKLIVPGVLEPTDNWMALVIKAADVVFEANENGGILAEDKDNGEAGVYCVNITNAGRLTVNGGHYYGGGTAIQVQKGELIVNGGKFEITPFGAPYYSNFLLNCIDASYKDGTAKIILRGGSYRNFDPAISKSESNVPSFVDLDCYQIASEVVDSNTWYTVSAK